MNMNMRPSTHNVVYRFLSSAAAAAAGTDDGDAFVARRRLMFTCAYAHILYTV